MRGRIGITLVSQLVITFLDLEFHDVGENKFQKCLRAKEYPTRSY